MKKLTVLSGKGGVGKSTISASIAILMARSAEIVVVDCDIDAPNLELVFGVEEEDFLSSEEITTSKKALLINEKCSKRRKCVQSCNFSAVTWDHHLRLPKFNNLLCVGCGACVFACPEDAVELKPVKNANIKWGMTKYKFPIVSGSLKMGESGSGKVVDFIKRKALEIAEELELEYMVVDSAAGIGCPVIASVRGSDYALLVTEPTPAAFSDLKRAFEIVKHFHVPSGLIINRWDINPEFTDEIVEYAKKEKISLFGKIPYDKRFVDALVNMKPVVLYEPEFEELFDDIVKKIFSNLSK
jgi:MinD superfamily P-loop ATPase